MRPARDPLTQCPGSTDRRGPGLRCPPSVHGPCSHTHVGSPSPAPSLGEAHRQSLCCDGFVAGAPATSAGSVLNAEAAGPRFLQGRLNNEARRGQRVLVHGVKKGWLAPLDVDPYRRPFRRPQGKQPRAAHLECTDRQLAWQCRPSADPLGRAGMTKPAQGTQDMLFSYPTRLTPSRPSSHRGRGSAKFSSFRFVWMAVSGPGCRPGQGKYNRDARNKKPVRVTGRIPSRWTVNIMKGK